MGGAHMAGRVGRMRLARACQSLIQWLQNEREVLSIGDQHAALVPGVISRRRLHQPPPQHKLLTNHYVQLPKVKGGVAATTIRFTNVVLQPFTLGSSGNNSQTTPTTPLVKLSFTLQIKRAAVRSVSGLTPLSEGNLLCGTVMLPFKPFHSATPGLLSSRPS